MVVLLASVSLPSYLFRNKICPIPELQMSCWDTVGFLDSHENSFGTWDVLNEWLSGISI